MLRLYLDYLLNIHKVFHSTTIPKYGFYYYQYYQKHYYCSPRSVAPEVYAGPYTGQKGAGSLEPHRMGHSHALWGLAPQGQEGAMGLRRGMYMA